ncbi:hypothetical protein [Acidiphilium iwatense]|uniref:Secreted protein n=1 Tax=Acidiphilium iwatense TaxID=768198 RepID=A0ABS9E2U1_9PROT|nr:hypothetical protein [Acidiphilium iwatense]MCF3948251.1 hypothetical protein [Acidiphilium iwatense]
MGVKTRLLGCATLAGVALVLAAPNKARAASDWQCAIVLCMANPGGPWQYPSCVAPMDRLEAWLSDPFQGFPVCPGMQGENVQKAIFGDVYIYQGPTGQKTAIVVETDGRVDITNQQPWISLPTEANP